MKNPVLLILAGFVFSIFCSVSAFCDTFENISSGEVLHGFAKSEVIDGNSVVVTEEKGKVSLKQDDWKVIYDFKGRANKVVVLSLDSDIMFEIEADALQEAIKEAADEGPLFILLEIDTPGGRTDIAQDICTTMNSVGNCRIIGFVKGGANGGAISAGAAVTLCCDEIYMANNTVMGAATMITIGDNGPASLKKAFGEEIGEKMSSMWRAYLASLAEQKGRPGLLARAMVDKDIEVVEVGDGKRRAFVDPVNLPKGVNIVHTWSKKGSLLTLTAEEAVKCGIANAVADSRSEVLKAAGAEGAVVVENTAWQDAGREFGKVKRRVDELRKSLDLRYKLLHTEQTRGKALSRLRSVKDDLRMVIRLAKRYADLQLNVEELEAQYNSVEAVYQEAKQAQRRRR